MSVGFLEEREGHKSSRRLILVWACGISTGIVATGLALRDMAVLGAGTGLLATILTTMQWGKTIEKGGNGKGAP